jgi:hypothetical protein
MPASGQMVLPNITHNNIKQWEPLKTSLRLFLDSPSLFLAEGRVLINELYAVFGTPFLQTSNPLSY